MNIIPENIYSLIINSKQKFIEKLIYNKKFENVELYVLNKDFMKKNQNDENTNKNLQKKFNGKTIINPEKNFFILDKEDWQIIKQFCPYEDELFILGNIFKQKCILQIDEKIRYFYFINDNKIEEGFFLFEDNSFADNIISKFENYNINNFFQKMYLEHRIGTQKGYDKKKIFEINIKEINYIIIRNNQEINKKNETKINKINKDKHQNFFILFRLIFFIKME